MIRTALILSAGQGSRLLPLTAEMPKCLIAFSGLSLLAWQVETLWAHGVTAVHVVTGFGADAVEAELARLARPGLSLTPVFNPFFKVADNLGSCWIARGLMDRDFLILNGDTLVSGAVVARLQATAGWPITVTVDEKPAYDSDDMKVNRAGDRLKAIGKTLRADQANAESIGLLAFRGEGVALFRDAVERMMRTPAGVAHWYLKIIDELAASGQVGVVSIAGLDWAEVDFADDIRTATRLTERWAKPIEAR